jgi:hypothetical protein
MKGKRRTIIVTAAIAGIVIAGLGVGYALTRPHGALPPEVGKQLTFSPMVVTKSPRLSADHYRVSKVQNNVQTLTYRITQGDKHVTVTEQLQPNQFTDIPDYKDHFLSGAFSQSSTVQTASGIMYTGLASKLENQQIAIMLEKGLLVFFYPSQPMASQDWRVIGDNLTVQNVSN